MLVSGDVEYFDSCIQLSIPRQPIMSNKMECTCGMAQHNLTSRYKVRIPEKEEYADEPILSSQHHHFVLSSVENPRGKPWITVLQPSLWSDQVGASTHNLFIENPGALRLCYLTVE